MKNYEVMQDFKGSRDGLTVRYFNKGERVKDYEFGEDLLNVAVQEKWIKPVAQTRKRGKA